MLRASRLEMDSLSLGTAYSSPLVHPCAAAAGSCEKLLRSGEEPHFSWQAMALPFFIPHSGARGGRA